jgi:alkylation response protein AidB-like acyl-CoA dehydrogenase
VDLGLSESERLLRDAAQAFLGRQADRRRLIELQAVDPGFDRSWVQPMAEAGWLGLLVPPEAGGGGASALEAAVVFEELGRGPLPGPFFSSAVLAALLVGTAEPSADRDAVLADIASGRALVTVAVAEPGRSWQGVGGSELELVPGGTLDGTKTFVPHAAGATHLLVGVRLADGRPGFALVPTDHPGLRLRPLSGFLAWNDVVELHGVGVEPRHLFSPAGGAAALDPAMATAGAVLAAYQVGGCGTLLDLSLDYASSRVQFGTPIGRFQRVQDHIVRIVNALDAARWTTYEALWKIDSGADGRAGAHMAQAVASESYFEAANAAHEVHAGIGSDPLFGLTLFTALSRSLYDYLGSPAWHRRQMVNTLGWASTGTPAS